MKSRPLRSIVLAVALLVVRSVTLSAAESPKEEAAMTAKLIAAIVKSDYETFLSNAEERLKQLTPKDLFEGAMAKSAPKLGTEHVLSYLGDFRQKGYRITLWKLSFKDGSDDMLAWLSMKDGKVGMFFVR